MSDRLFTDGSRPQVSIGVLCHIPDIFQMPELKRCLDSLKDFPVIVVSGKWNDIESTSDYNHPQLNELIESYANVTHIFTQGLSEAGTRNIYLEECNDTVDFLFWVDSDEWIEMPLGKDFFLRGITDLFGVNDYSSQLHEVFHQRDGNDVICKQKRLIQYPSKCRHRERHNSMYYDNKEILAGEIKNHAPRGLILHSEKSYRSTKRDKYMKSRVEGVLV